MVPRIDISALFSDSAGRAETDAAIIAAAGSNGFMTVCGLPRAVPIDAMPRRALLRLFELPATETRKLWRQKFDPAHRNVYRGWFPLQNGHETYKEGIDLGPDLAFGSDVVDPSDPLREATPLPPENALPASSRMPKCRVAKNLPPAPRPMVNRNSLSPAAAYRVTPASALMKAR